MRIAFVAPRYGTAFGGVETHVHQLSTRMAALGHTVDVLAPENDRGLPAEECSAGVTIRRFYVPVPTENYAFAPSLGAYLRDHARTYDIVHAHSYHRLAALQAALCSGAPLIFTPHYHGTGHTAWRKLLHVPYRRLGTLIMRRARSIICVSSAEAALVRAHFPHAAARVIVVPNGVDVQALRAAQPCPETSTVVLSAGRLESYKRVDLTIKALAHLDSGFVMRITGDGPARRELEALVSELALSTRVHFLGAVAEATLHSYYRSAAVYVSMSNHEAMGITLIEAIVAGSCVVASDIPAHRETAHGVGAGLVSLIPPLSSPTVLAQAIQQAADRHARGALPIPVVASWDDVAERTLRIYSTAAGAIL